MGDAVDDKAAHATDTLAAIMVEGDRHFAGLDELLVEHVEHFEEGRVLANAVKRVADHLAGIITIFLSPHLECQFHVRFPWRKAGCRASGYGTGRGKQQVVIGRHGDLDAQSQHANHPPIPICSSAVAGESSQRPAAPCARPGRRRPGTPTPPHRQSSRRRALLRRPLSGILRGSGRRTIRAD